MIVAALALGGLTSLSAQALSDLHGKWTLKKKSDAWGDVTQTVEFKGDQFTYRVQDKDGRPVLSAQGKVKVERLGPFKVMRLSDIQGGYSEGQLEPTNDDRAIIYSLGWNTLNVALNFDQERDGERVEADSYTKVRPQ